MKTIAQLHKDADRLWLWMNKFKIIKRLIPSWVFQTITDLISFFKNNQTVITEEDLAREVSIQLLAESGTDKVYLEKNRWKSAKVLLNDIMNDNPDGTIYVNRIVDHIKSERITTLIHKTVAAGKK